MPFTNAWNHTAPTDAQAANLLGEDIRQLRLDIEERMNSAVCADLTADPLVVYAPRYIRATKSITVALAAGGASSQQTVTVTGAVVGDLVVVSWKGDGTNDGRYLVCNGYVSAADTVKVQLTNYDPGTAYNIIAETLIVGVLRPLP